MIPEWFRGATSAFVFFIGVWVVVLGSWSNELSEAVTRLEVHRSSTEVRKLFEPRAERGNEIRALAKMRTMLNEVNGTQKDVDRAMMLASIAGLAGAVILSGPPTWVVAGLVFVAVSMTGASLMSYFCGWSFPCRS